MRALKPSSAPQQATAWLWDVALPLWSEAGYDSVHGGFAERFGRDGAAPESPHKRLRVQARQVYVFSHAHLMGWPGRGLERAGGGMDFMRKGWMPGRGWARRLSAQGEILDDTLDLYDQAFALFALGWYVQASGDGEVADLARQTLTAIQSRMRHPSGQGYHHLDPPLGPWQQNPHMHLLEAMIVLARATGEDIYRQEAQALVRLFRERFHAGGTLAEYYGHDWKRADGAPGRITEPGHHFEWAWLLCEYRKLTGDDTGAEARALYDFAERHGSHPDQALTIDAVRDDGIPLEQSVRLWPQTEALKANLAMMETHGLDTRVRCQTILDDLFALFLDRPRPGLWLDHFEADRRTVKSADIPASSLYHIHLAFSELMRLAHLFAP